MTPSLLFHRLSLGITEEFAEIKSTIFKALQRNTTSKKSMILFEWNFCNTYFVNSELIGTSAAHIS